MISLLYIDDEQGLLDLGQIFLESEGEFKVTTALSGEEGLRCLKNRDFDAVVSDYQMPEMNGIEFLKTVRNSCGNLPFILFTGRGREEVVIEAINNGVDFYLQKGGDPKSQFAELSHKVRQAVNRRRAEAALSDSEQRLADIINFLPDATFAIDTGGVVIAWNRAMERMTGVRAQDILGKGDYEYSLPFYHERRPLLINLVLDDSADIGARYPFVSREGKTLVSEITIPHFNNGTGAALWFTASPLYNRKGEIAGAIESIREITERKRAEERLVSANREYTNLLGQIQDVYYRADLQGRLVRASRSWAVLLGYDDIAECLGRNIACDFYYYPSDRQRLVDEISRSGKVTGYEITLKKKDGTPILVEVSSHPYFDTDGSVIGIEGTFRDITFRKKADEELRAAYEQLAANEEELKSQYNELAASGQRIRESEQKYRTVFETTGTAMLMIEDDTTISLVNSEFCRLSGYSKEEIENKKQWMEFVIGEDRGPMLSRHRQRRTGTAGALNRYEFRFVTRSGEIRDILISIDIIPGTAKSVASLLDITEGKRASDELRAANEQLVASEEELRSQYDELARSERLIRMSEARLQYMLGFYDYAQKDERELLDYAIEGAGIVTGSALGYLVFLNRDETELAMYAWSKTAMTECSMATKPMVYPIEKTGLWGEAVRRRCPVITNDYSAPDPAKKGCPEGHPVIVRHMNVPVIDDGHIVLVAGVANKAVAYTGNDASELLLLMQGLWEILKRRRAETERRRAEEALAESERRYRTVFETAEEGIWTVDSGFRTVSANRKMQEIFGYPEEEMTGRPVWDFVPAEDAESIREEIGKRPLGIPSRYERRWVKKDGSVIWCLTAATPLFAPDGSFMGSFGMFTDITERRGAEDALRESERKYRTLVETTGTGFVIIDGEGRVLDANAEYVRLTGHAELREISGRKVTEWTAAHERQKNAEAVRQCLKNGSIRNFEIDYTDSAGTITPIEVNATVLRSGGSVQILTLCRDISDRRSAQDALLKSEARLGSILHGSPVLQFVIDRSHRVILWNRALEEYSGIRASDIIGTDLQWRAFYPEKRPVLADLLVDGVPDAIERWYPGKCRKSPWVEEACEATDFFPLKGSSGKWLSFTAAPVRDGNGTIIGAIETLEDVTERVNAENALRQSEEWARTILNTAQAGIIIVDAATHRILEANNKALELIGQPPERVIGSVCHRFICPAEEGRCPVTDCGMTVDTSERILITSEGAQVPVLKTVVPATVGGRDLLVESFVDITERKRSESAIREANRKLNLLSSITRHDVANQLTVVQGYTQLAARKEPDPAVKDFLGKIRAAVETIRRQIEFSKEYQELGVHAPAWFNAGGVIRGARPKKVRLRCSCDNFEVFADPMIGRVFFNLFDNAMKYGEHVTTVTASCRNVDDGLVITFADNGVGIPLGEKQKIFEKGYGKNTGLGLFLVREILAITGISIREAGVQGRGARFEITVPKGMFREKP
jgi:PAS domain S-box-containing protein